MPKVHLTESALHDWVCGLTFQMQALLMTAMRGPDENNKYNAAKAIVRYLRGVIIKPAGDWGPHNYKGSETEFDDGVVGPNDNDFMWGDYNKFAEYSATFWQDHDEYPHHFIMHLVHCAEVVGYKHPILQVRLLWLRFYCSACDAFHMNPETEKEMDERLSDFGCGIHNTISYKGR